MLNDESAVRQREMLALEAQLRSSVRLQLENTRDSIRGLGEGPDRLRAAGDALTRVIDLCRQSETLIDNYPFIKQVSRTHQNFSLTKRVYDEFCALDAKVERCAALLEADQETGQPHNLLLVYSYLSRLETFRKQTLELMSDAPSTALYTIKRYFKKLDDLANAFDEFFWRLPRELFRLAAEGQSAFIVAIVKVLWAMEAEQRPRFHAILDDMIAQKFTTAISESGALPTEDPSTVLDALQFWQNDLLLVRNDLVPKFPAEANILDFFVLTYHRNIHAVLSQCLSTKLGPADILYIIGWVRTYHDEIAAQLGISADDLEPRLLDDREPELIASYVALSRSKVNEWIGNLLAAESKAFTERTAAPDTDAENHYMTPAGIDLYQIVKQHIDTAAQASKSRLLLEIVAECAKAVNGFVSGMTRVLEAERVKSTERQPDSVAPYLEDYIIMLGNTCLKWVSYVDDLTSAVEAMIAPEYSVAANKLLKGIADAFVNLAKTCTQVLVDVIFRSIRPAIAQLFTAAWYNGGASGPSGGLMETVLATFDDYFRDYQQHADTFLLNKLVADVLERTLLSYLDQMRSKACKLRMPAAASLLEADVAAMCQFFAGYRDAERVKKALDPLARLVALISSSQRMLFLEFVAFWKVYPDLSLGLFEELLTRRDDLDKTTIREIIESCRKKTAEESKIGDIAPSIFSKLPTK